MPRSLLLLSLFLVPLLARGVTLTVSWGQSSPTAKSFVVERANGAFATTGFKPIGVTTATSFLDVTPTSYTAYTYRVKAMDGATSSPYSNLVSVATVKPGSRYTVAGSNNSTSATTKTYNLKPKTKLLFIAE